MQEQLHQFKLNNVWELVERPDPRKHNIIGTKWIYRNKQDEHGQVVRNKYYKKIHFRDDTCLSQ